MNLFRLFLRDIILNFYPRFASQQSHYSVKTCASVGGLGTDHCIEVPADDRGKMIPSELERLILENKSKGNIPFFVSATAGTTVFGAFDPIHEIADLCKKYKLWLHIDVSIILCKFALCNEWYDR